MDNLNSLIKFNHSFMSYKDFLFNYPNNFSSSKEKINTLEILFSALSFIINIDKITTKDENSKEYIDDYILEQIVSIIGVKNNNKYYLGKIEFTTKEELIKVIRNKIAHGEFYIDNSSENLIFIIENEKITISKNSFYSFVILLTERIDLYTVSTSYNRNQLYSNTKKVKAIKHYHDIDEFLSKIYSIDYTFTSKEPITPTKKSYIEELLKRVPYYTTDYENKTNKEINPDYLKTIFNQSNIEVIPNITPLLNTKHYSKLKQFIISNLTIIETLDLETQIRLISNWYHKLENDSKPLENITSGIHYNLHILNQLENNQYKNLNEALLNIQSNSLFSSIIEIILVAELLGFYSHYHYPLENLFKSKDNIEEDVDYFDYSTLDLSTLKPDIFEIPEGRKASYEDAVNASERRLIIIDAEIKRLQTQLANIKRLVLNASTEEEKQRYLPALKAVQTKIDLTNYRQEQEILNLEEKSTQLRNFDITNQESYYYNRYLIEYIRNAIAHGNIEFSYSDTDTNILNSIIRFINKKDNHITLDLSVSLLEFEHIFNIDNISTLNNYLNKQKNDRTL